MNIEIEKYGDDAPYTDCIMISDKTYDMEELLNEFVEKYKIPANEKYSAIIAKRTYSNDGLLDVDHTGISNIEYGTYQSVPNLFIEFLTLKGFKKLSTHKVHFSD